MYTLKSHIHHYNLVGKRVFLRADLNVPLAEGKIVDDFRLMRIVPTIRLLQEKGAKVIIATHIGRPNAYDANLSTKNLMSWFTNHGFAVDFEPDIATAIDKSFDNFHSLLLIDNLRFFRGEKERDPHFAKQLAMLGDYYVNDAFGALHRNDASLTLTPQFFDYHHKTIGLLVEEELTTLNRSLEKPKKPFVVVLGGGKVIDKIPVIESLITKADTILIGPALSYSFAYAQNQPIGTSLIDPHATTLCLEIIKKAHDAGVKLIFPEDYLISYTDIYDSNLSITTQAAFPDDGIGVTIGPRTQQLFAQNIQNAHTVFFNGLMGTVKNATALDALMPIFNAATSVPEAIIAGGDSVAACRMLGLTDKVGFLSTGGGATLALIADKKLPALDALSE